MNVNCNLLTLQFVFFCQPLHLFIYVLLKYETFMYQLQTVFLILILVENTSILKTLVGFGQNRMDK